MLGGEGVKNGGGEEVGVLAEGEELAKGVGEVGAVVADVAA